MNRTGHNTLILKKEALSKPDLLVNMQINMEKRRMRKERTRTRRKLEMKRVKEKGERGEEQEGN